MDIHKYQINSLLALHRHSDAIDRSGTIVTEAPNQVIKLTFHDCDI